jgi:hypothetical protein
MNDFATEEFVTKNIRVMPMAGASTHGDGQSAHDSRHMAGGGDVSDQEDNKYNIDAYHEITDIRDTVKAQKARADEIRRIQEEKDKKKNKNK